MTLRLVLALSCLLAGPVSAADRLVAAEAGALRAAIAAASPGDVLDLAPGRHDGPVLLDRPVSLLGRAGAVIDGHGKGTVITVTAPDVTIRGLEIVGSGSSHEAIDSGVRLLKGSERAVVEDNRLLGNLVGVDIHGARDAIVRDNVIVGRDDPHMNARGNGVYVWSAPGLLVEGNDISLGRDGIFVNVSDRNTFRNNVMRNLRFAVHYMYAHHSEVTGNVSVGNHLGFALMYSHHVKVQDNLSLGDRDHGVMLNYVNNAEVSGNLVRGAGKCTFIYNAHRNLIHANRFEGCGIGIHFTAGSERNALTSNAFLGNRTQVKYVGSRNVEWSFEGRGNFWSDHPAFDLDGDGTADAPFRPNDLMDHILWSQPAAALLVGSPAVQLIRWSQASFPATLPGGVLDSHPLMAPVEIAVPGRFAAMEAALPPRPKGDDDADALAGH
ncbi:nitrous oxide reductase family maturation protein NosD [Cereibacter sphaeroides]|uniref:nitrous oxide reductase family maturation protein NosD n=1 Tax=Cereibacter sphaeroides TaxID=1063 RepID=UPI001F34AA8F|nr:nitrous oxide reductase family maturation protein NosD [Cereibacter sphaeroides]MCE6951509.1 nitrous oxide reductase family maturation protein NosD [Cereibacter sphaeroides]